MNPKRLIIFFCTLMITLSPLQVVDVLAVINKPYVVAESAILMDGKTGQILYQKNANRQLEPASITKLLTALMAVENLDPEDSITFSRNAVLSIEAGSSHIGLREGESITVNDAMHGLLLMSANEVANGIAEEVSGSIEAFSDAMNQRAVELGANNTHFINPNGLHAQGHLSTAYDMALITKELLKSDYFLDVMKDITYEIPPTNMVDETRYLSQGHKMINDKKNVKIYREDVIAGKTGYTTQAGHTLVTVSKRDDRILIAVILNTLAPNLYSDTSILLDFGYDSYKRMTLLPGDYELTLPLIDGEQNIIGSGIVSLKSKKILNIPSTMSLDDLVFESEIPPNIASTLSQGDKIGNVIVSVDGETLGDITMVIEQLTYDDPKNIPETPSKIPKKSSVGIVVLLLGLIVGSGGLYYVYKSKPHNYYDYKLKRDAQKKSSQNHHSNH
jgi:D-alanyl-D-alanine carboxypeptidase